MSPREIDALVAEHIFGVTQHGGGWFDSCGDLFSWGPDALEFSTDPAASKQLRDKMHWEGWYYCIRLCDAFSGGDGKLYCHFYKHDRDVSGEEWADTEEMAVALAALAAAGKPVTQ